MPTHSAWRIEGAHTLTLQHIRLMAPQNPPWNIKQFTTHPPHYIKLNNIFNWKIEKYSLYRNTKYMSFCMNMVWLEKWIVLIKVFLLICIFLLYVGLKMAWKTGKPVFLIKTPFSSVKSYLYYVNYNWLSYFTVK